MLVLILLADTLAAFALDRMCSFLFGETRRKPKFVD